MTRKIISAQLFIIFSFVFISCSYKDPFQEELEKRIDFDMDKVLTRLNQINYDSYKPQEYIDKQKPKGKYQCFGKWIGLYSEGQSDVNANGLANLALSKKKFIG